MPTPDSPFVRGARRAAWLTLGLGWLLPLGAAEIGERAGFPGLSAFRWIAGTWLFLALVYAVVHALRVRRGLVE